eukprot:g17489.t1
MRTSFVACGLLLVRLRVVSGCLADGVPVAERAYIKNNQGSDISIGILEGAWPSAALLSEMLRLLIGEALGDLDRETHDMGDGRRRTQHGTAQDSVLLHLQRIPTSKKILSAFQRISQEFLQNVTDEVFEEVLSAVSCYDVQHVMQSLNFLSQEFQVDLGQGKLQIRVTNASMDSLAHRKISAKSTTKASG